MNDRTCKVLVFFSWTTAPTTGEPELSETIPVTDRSAGDFSFFCPYAKPASATIRSAAASCLNMRPFSPFRQMRRSPIPLHQGLLDPPGRSCLLPDHKRIQEPDGLSQTFFGREQAVLVLDREHVIVAEHAERGDELSPPLGAVA